MNRKIVISRKLKQVQDKELNSGTKWDQSDNYILAVYQRYLDHKISADTLMSFFPGRSFHAINNKVYNIRGRRGGRKQSYVDPNQTCLPLGGELK